ncbi:MAG TPA: hypothetical protein VHC90_05560 [Bryobacteraceae bacterium]|nr:hypothetical protein [Bryobacteraceae bacterium]
MELLDCIHPEHVSLYEVRIKAIAASRLGVFGKGTQLDTDLMAAVRAKSPPTADLIERAITAHRDWCDACEDKAPADVIAKASEKALQSSKDLEASFSN